MSQKADHLRLAIQKLTEAIWNLDQLVPLKPQLSQEYGRIQKARAGLMKQLKSSD